jgi:hypothetical protein
MIVCLLVRPVEVFFFVNLAPMLAPNRQPFALPQGRKEVVVLRVS